MSTHRFARLAALLLLVAAFAACGDVATSPTPATIAESGPTFAPSTSNERYVAKGTVLRRTSPMKGSVTVSTTLRPGRQGGVLHIREAGLRVDFAPYSVKQRTVVWVTAHAGNKVIYEFGPHGIVFDSLVTIEQDLRGTDAYKDLALAYDLKGGYVPKSLDDVASDGTASIAELFSVDIVPEKNRVNPRVARFQTRHFSGYILASGVKEELPSLGGF